MIKQHRVNAAVSALFASFLICSASLAEDIPAYANCKSFDKKAACKLVWDFGDDSKTKVTLQKWDREFAGWQVVSQRKSRKMEKGVRVPETGRLYRVLACGTTGPECLSSSVVWAPDWTKPKNMPDVVLVKHGDSMLEYAVTKHNCDGTDAGPAQVTAQYNMYLVRRELENVWSSTADLPPMVIQDYGADGPLSLEDQVTDNVAVVYEKIRAQLEQYRRTGHID